MLIPVVIGITLFIFIVMSLARGDPAALVLGADASYEEILAKRVEMGLDRPVFVRYINYMSGVARGDFGSSWFHGYLVMT